MNNLDPVALDSVSWAVADASRRLAEMVADLAVSGDGNIPEELLRAFHDSKQLKSVVDQLKNKATNAAMAEVMA